MLEHLAKTIVTMLAILVPYGVLRGRSLKRHGKPIDRKKEVVRATLVGYFLLLGLITLKPAFFHISSEVHPSQLIRTIIIEMPYQPEGVNLVPFQQILFFLDRRDAFPLLVLSNLLGNLLLFVPFGLLLPVYDRERFGRVGTVLLYGVLLSAGIETVQYFIGRTVDIDDVILNTAGGAIGIALYRLLPKGVVERISVRHREE